MGREVTRQTGQAAEQLERLAKRVREMLVEGGFPEKGERGDQGPQGFRGVDGEDADIAVVLAAVEKGIKRLEDDPEVARIRQDLDDLREQLGKVRIPVGGGGGPPHPPARTGTDVYWVLANFPEDDPRVPVWRDAVDLPGGAGGGAPTNATYLVTTANATLTNEVVVGATPGGELGGTWDAPTVDAVHSGSSHAAVQAAAEATAAAALAAHVAAADPHTVYQRESEKGVAGGYASLDGGATVPDAQIPSGITRDTELAAHVDDTTDAHDASAISVVPGGALAADDVQEALLELDTEKVPTTRTITAGAALTGGGDLSADRTLDVGVDNSTIEVNADALRVKAGGITAAHVAADVATQAELDAHITDSSAAHAASAVSVDSTTLSGTGADVQASLEEIDNLLDDHSTRHEDGGADEISIAGLAGTSVELAAHLVDTTVPHKLDDLAAPDDNTDLNASTTAHGLLRKLSGVATEYLDGSGAFSTPAGGGGSGTNFTRAIAQAGHGLAVGDVVRYNGTAYVEAKADTAANAEVVGVVSAVADADNFTLLFGGRITTLSGLTAGSVYFLSATAAGVLTTTEPTTMGHVSKPLLIADSTTTGYFFNFRGAVVATTETTSDFNAAFLMGGM